MLTTKTKYSALDAVKAAFEGDLEVLKQSDLNSPVTVEDFVKAVHPTFLGSQYLYSTFWDTFISRYAYGVAKGVGLPAHPSNLNVDPSWDLHREITCLIAAILGGNKEAIEYIVEQMQGNITEKVSLTSFDLVLLISTDGSTEHIKCSTNEFSVLFLALIMRDAAAVETLLHQNDEWVKSALQETITMKIWDSTYYGELAGTRKSNVLDVALRTNDQHLLACVLQRHIELFGLAATQDWAKTINLKKCTPEHQRDLQAILENRFVVEEKKSLPEANAASKPEQVSPWTERSRYILNLFATVPTPPTTLPAPQTASSVLEDEEAPGSAPLLGQRKMEPA